MPETRKNSPAQSVQYQITVQGILNASWAEWFGGTEFSTVVNTPDGLVTVIRASFADQAELRGVLVKLWDLNATLIAVQRLRPKIGESTNQTED